MTKALGPGTVAWRRRSTAVWPRCVFLFESALLPLDPRANSRLAKDSRKRLPVALVHVERPGPLRTHCGRFPRALAHPPHNQRRSLCDGARGWHFSAAVGGRSPPPAERAAAGQRHVCARHRCGSPTAERPPPEPARAALRSIAAGLRFLHMAPRVGAEAARWTRRLTRGSGVQPPYHRPVRACSTQTRPLAQVQSSRPGGPTTPLKVIYPEALERQQRRIAVGSCKKAAVQLIECNRGVRTGELGKMVCRRHARHPPC